MIAPTLPDYHWGSRIPLPLLLEELLLAKPPSINANPLLLLTILLLTKLLLTKLLLTKLLLPKLLLLRWLSRYLWLISLRPHPRRTLHHLRLPLRNIRLHPPR